MRHNTLLSSPFPSYNNRSILSQTNAHYFTVVSSQVRVVMDPSFINSKIKSRKFAGITLIRFQKLLTNRATKVSLSDSNKTLQICKVRQSNRHVFIYIGKGSSLRAETTLRTLGVFELESVAGHKS